VEVDYLNLLLLTKGRNTIESYFDANGEACIQPNALRIHGNFTESIDWDDVKQLRLDHVYMLPIEPVAFEWPEPVTSASTSATTTPNNTPNKKPKIEILTDF
jgi:hypothetical protein